MLSRLILAIDRSPRARKCCRRLVFAAGLGLWLAVQGALMLVPLWEKAVFPEVDDISGYLVKAEQMRTCFFQDCRGLEDLRLQLLTPSSDPLAARQRELAASRVFPVYHVLLSAVLVGLSKFGLSLVEAYRLVWTLSPLFFGAAFACLLWSIWGFRAAGLALGLLAFKVFPDTGLNHMAPSNLAMAAAALVWARIVGREGRAYLALPVGSLISMSLHPVGRIYALMGAVFSIVLRKDDRKNRISAGITLALVLASSLLPLFVKRPVMLTLTPFVGDGSFFQGFYRSSVEILSNLIRMEAGLFGLLPFFFLFLTLGFLTVEKRKQKIALKVSAVYLVFLVGLLYYGPTQPADAFFRIWIPFVVIAFGAVGQSWVFILEAVWKWSLEAIKGNGRSGNDLHPISVWPLLALAVFMGYSVHMTTRGGEQVAAMIRHQKESQPLALSEEQPEILLTAADPGDRVLYTSMILMPWYFIHGAMNLGAVYYHPDLAGTEITTNWLKRSDIRFAVTYNPLVWHPSYRGVDENRWWTSAPEFRYSPLSRRRRHAPLAREGKLYGDDFKWIEIIPKKGPVERFRIRIENPGRSSELEIMPVKIGHSSDRTGIKIIPVAGEWSGWLEFSPDADVGVTGVKLVLPTDCPYRLTGMVFDDSPFHWPWLTEADMNLMTGDPETGLVRISFNPAANLPPSFGDKEISVMDDNGSSVLFTSQNPRHSP